MAELSQLEACQERLGYSFQDESLLIAALTHSSSADHRGDSNERMEFLGDAILGMVVCTELYHRLPNAQEGDLTKIKSAVVSRRACATAAERLDLADCLSLGQGMTPDAHLPRSILAAALEAITAAIYLDSGLEPAREFVVRAMQEEIEAASASEHHFNFKSQLQQHAQKEMNITPTYELLDEKGPDHAKCFEIAVRIGHRQFPGAWGPSKKDAEQKAARIALEALGVLVEAEVAGG